MTTLSRSLYTYKLQEARRIFDAHNYLRKPEPGDTRISFDDFKIQLVALGGTSNELLKQCTVEDLQDCGLPRLVARRLAEVFSSDDETDATKEIVEEAPSPHRTFYPDRVLSKSDEVTPGDKHYQETGKGIGSHKTRWPYHNRVPLPQEARQRLGWDEVPGLRLSVTKVTNVSQGVK